MDNFSLLSAFYKRYISLHGLNITVLVSYIVSDMLFLWTNVDTHRLEAHSVSGWLSRYRVRLSHGRS